MYFFLSYLYIFMYLSLSLLHLVLVSWVVLRWQIKSIHLCIYPSTLSLSLTHFASCYYQGYNKVPFFINLSLPHTRTMSLPSLYLSIYLTQSLIPYTRTASCQGLYNMRPLSICLSNSIASSYSDCIMLRDICMIRVPSLFSFYPSIFVTQSLPHTSTWWC